MVQEMSCVLNIPYSTAVRGTACEGISSEPQMLPPSLHPTPVHSVSSLQPRNPPKSSSLLRKANPPLSELLPTHEVPIGPCQLSISQTSSSGSHVVEVPQPTSLSGLSGPSNFKTPRTVSPFMASKYVQPPPRNVEVGKLPIGSVGEFSYGCIACLD